MELVISALLGLVVTGLIAIIRKLWTYVEKLRDDLNILKAESMRRQEITEHVDKELTKLKLEIKDDYRQVLDSLNRVNDKLDRVYERLSK